MTTLCAICGNNTATTRDHIPPQGLYPKPRDNDINLNTVPACSECNKGSSVEDEEFKIIIGLSTGDFHPQPQKVIDWIAGTVSHNNRIANQIFSTQRSTFSNYRGPILEPVVAVTFDREKYNKIISKIVRGLYWMERGVPLGCVARISIFPGDDIKPEFAKSMQELMDCLEPHALNKDTFFYKVLFGDDGTSIWGIQFFKKHTVFAYVEAP